MAFVNEDQLFGISKEIVKFFHDSEAFLSYQPPLPYLEGLQKSDEGQREEVLRRQALQSVLHDDDEMVMPPFPYDEDDLSKLKGFEMEYQKDVSLSTWFDDIDKIGVEFKDGDDLVPQSPQTLSQAMEN